MNALCTSSLLGIILLSVNCMPSASNADHHNRLLELHNTILEAHLEDKLESWMEIEADSMLSLNRGSMTYSVAEERRSLRENYLGNTHFESYRDIKDPIVQISDDGSMGWLAAEIEVIGTYTSDNGDSVQLSEVWAWVELYERSNDGWKLSGIVSNSRPL